MAEAGNEQVRPKMPRVPGRALFKRGGLKSFVADVSKEMRQTTWPTPNETWHFTGIVLVVIIVFVGYLFAMDVILGYIMNFLIGRA
jgi:preprotein translocase SecE subunit